MNDCETTDTEIVRRAMCLLTSQFSFVLIAPTRGDRMARLGGTWVTGYRPRWLTRL